MNPRLLLIPALPGLIALLTGWAIPGQPAAPLSVTRYPHNTPTELLARPDEATGAALPDLTTALSGMMAPKTVSAPEGAPPPKYRPPPPPPPPDVALVFRRQVSAVIDQGAAGLAVLVVDSTGEVRQSRLLRIGDSFAGGWRLAGLTMDEATLRKGDQQKRVPLYGAQGGA